MYALVFGLRRLPDLTLAKYSNLGNRGIDGVLEAHQGFLRLFKGRTGTSLHLLYTYDPSAHDGERLAVNLLVCDVRRQPDLDNVEQLIASSPLSPFFDLIPLVGRVGSGPLVNLDERSDLYGEATKAPFLFEVLLGPGGGINIRASSSKMQHDISRRNAIAEASWSWMASLAKRGRFIVQQPPSREAPNGFFTLPEYEQDDGGRLFALMRLMEALGESLRYPLAYRVDLYPTDRMDTLRSALPLPYLKAQQYAQQGRRDYVLEGVERSYEDSLRVLESSPLFLVNAFAFAPSGEVARALLDAASSESVKKGDVHIAQFKAPANEPWHVGSFLTDDHWSRSRTSIDQETILVPRTEIVGSRRIARPGYVHVDVRAKDYPHADMQCLFTLSEVAPFFRFPTLNDGESVQLLKETAPPPVQSEYAIFLGRDTFKHDAYFKMELLSRHAFISGVPGSGKTNTMHHLCTSLINADVPILVFEPAKHEYRALLNAQLKHPVRLLCPGGEEAFPLRMNPFEIPYGVTVGHHIGRLVEVFEGSFPLEGALPFLLDRAIEAVYAKHNWDPKDRSEENTKKTWPTLSELYAQMTIEMEKEDYSGELKGNLASAIRMRIGGLLRRELGELFDVSVSTYPPSKWLEMSAVIELEALKKAEANFFTLLLMVLIRESLMVDPIFHGSTPMRHVIFVEEAHNLVGPTADAVTGEHADPKIAATSFLSDMLREVRAYREGIVIADQLPTAIAPEVLKNTSLKIALRMTSEDDRALLGSMMSASAMQLEHLGVANPGDALVLYEELQRPFELRMAEWMGVEGTPEYVRDEKERHLRTESLKADMLKSKLLREKVDWYSVLRSRICFADKRTFEENLQRLHRKWAEVLDCCTKKRELDKYDIVGKISPEDYVKQCQKIIERVAKLTGTNPGQPSIDKVYSDYCDALDSFASRMRSWHGFDIFADSADGKDGAFIDPYKLLGKIGAMDLYECLAHIYTLSAHELWLTVELQFAEGGADWLVNLKDHPARRKYPDELKRRISSVRRVRQQLIEDMQAQSRINNGKG